MLLKLRCYVFREIRRIIANRSQKDNEEKKNIDEMQTLTKTFNHCVKHRKKDREEKTGKKSLETETERAKSNADPLENGERLDAFV